MKKKKTKIIEAKLKVKTQTILKINVLRDFNGYHKIIKAESIIMV